MFDIIYAGTFPPASARIATRCWRLGLDEMHIGVVSKLSGEAGRRMWLIEHHDVSLLIADCSICAQWLFVLGQVKR